MKFAFAFILAVSACMVNSASIDLQTHPLQDGKKQPQQMPGNNTNAVRVTFTSSTAQPKYSRICAGVVLTTGWIMTAAECFDSPEQHHFIRITVPGEYEYKGKQYETERDQFKPRANWEFKLHPQFNNKTKANNIALLKTSPVFTPDKSSQLYLPYVVDSNRTYVTQTAVVTTYPTGRRTNKVRISSLNVVILNNCTQTNGTPVRKDEHLCAKATKGEHLTDKEIGAPVVFQANITKRRKLLGIVTSVGPSKDGVQTIEFTRIHSYLNWIGLVTGMPFCLEKTSEKCD